MCTPTERTRAKKWFTWLLFAAIISALTAAVLSICMANKRMSTSKPLYRIDVSSPMDVEIDLGDYILRMSMPVASLSMFGTGDYLLEYSASKPSRERGYGQTRVWGSFPDSMKRDIASLFAVKPDGDTRVEHWHKDYKVVNLMAGDDGICELADISLFSVLKYAFANRGQTPVPSQIGDRPQFHDKIPHRYRSETFGHGY